MLCMLFKSNETVPYQPKSLKHEKLRLTTESKMQKSHGFSNATTRTGLNIKAQSHTLIWIQKLSCCLGASNSSFSKTIIMTNLCISSLPNPLSMSLAWGHSAEKLTQICDMWLPIGNGLKLGTMMVWAKIKVWKFSNGQHKRPLTDYKFCLDLLEFCALSCRKSPGKKIHQFLNYWW